MEQKIRRDRNMGDNLRKLRLDHDISQEKLCAELQRRGCVNVKRKCTKRASENVQFWR